MLELNEIKSLHLEITNKCQASCPMCSRNMQGGVINPFIEEIEVNFEKFTTWFSDGFIAQLDKIYMCGNLGDPIIAKDTLKIFQYCRNVNPTIVLGMNTNGSARDKEFWEQLAEVKVKIRFGIDGLEDTHQLYRIGTNFNNIIRNAEYFIKNGGHAIWDMLVFKHNEHQVEACAELSKEIGFIEFCSKNTARFKEDHLNVLNKAGQQIHVIYPTVKSSNISKNTNNSSTIISCKSKNNKEIYISCHGIVTPCCWLDKNELPHINPTRIEYLTRIGKYPSLVENTLEEIFDKGTFNLISNTWNNNPLLECSKQCGAIDRFNKQFE